MTRKLLLIGAIAALSLPAAAEAQGRGRNVDGVPPGHRPPPGMCRIWIDGVPPGRQPAPTSCREALRNRPSNARVIYGDDARVGSKGKGKYKHKKGDDRYEGRRDRDDDRYESRRDRDDDDRYEDRRDRDDDDRYERERRSGTIQERIEEARRRDSTRATPSSDTVRRTSVGGVMICTDSQGRNRICN